MIPRYFISLLAALFVSVVSYAGDTLRVERVIDGDTFVLSSGDKVRLIGVDTPETVHPSKPVEYFGREASDFLKRTLTDQSVFLEYDWQRVDKYGRLLAYVYLLDGTFVNAEIIRQGYGHAYTKYPFRQDYMDQFRQLEVEARESHRGLWSDEAAKASENWQGGDVTSSIPASLASSDTIVYVSKGGAKYHRQGCSFLVEPSTAIGLDAIGDLRPCVVCNPPSRSGIGSSSSLRGPPSGLSGSEQTGDNQIVYVTRTGAKYHADGCRYLSRSKIPMKLSEAAQRYDPCSVCNPPRLR